jgi:uncharacterized surface protein with fasciclin (FAS1) repeats
MRSLSEREPAPDLVGTLASSTRFRTWITILVATQLIDDLREAGPWLVLAPSDVAFARLEERELDGLLAGAEIETLIDLAEHHVARSPTRRIGGPYTSLLGEVFTIGADGRIDGGARIVARYACANGSIAVVDRVVVPPSLRASRAVRGRLRAATRAA